MKFSHQLDMDRIICPVCGIPFAAPDYFVEVRRQQGGSIICPNGHLQSWPKQNPATGNDSEKLIAIHKAEQAEAKIKDLTRKLKKQAKTTE